MSQTTEIELKKEDIDLLQEQLHKTTAKYKSASKKIAGVTSAYKRKCIVDIEKENIKPQNRNVDSHSVATSTYMQNINTDIIHVDNSQEKCREEEDTLDGILYYKYSDRIKKVTAGKKQKYFKIPTVSSNDRVSKRHVNNRANSTLKFFTAMSGSNETSEKVQLLTQVIKKDKLTFLDAIKKAGIHVQRRMTVTQAVQMTSLLRLSTSKLRDMRNVLRNTGMANFLPSEPKIRKEQTSLTSHISKEKVEIGKALLQTKSGDDRPSEKAFVRVKDLKQFIADLVKNSKELRKDQEFEKYIWLLFSGDKGGNLMKFHVEIINDVQSGSRDAVHPYCMFESLDSVDNMWKIFEYYRKVLIDIQKSDFTLDNGMKVKAFLGGNYHFLSDTLGHQGQASAFPSPLDLVERNHLKNHSGTPHSRKYWGNNITMRTIEDYKMNYCENICDNRLNENLRKHGKDHNSVINDMLFPISTLENVVPAILHIYLGITLNIFNLLEDVCQKIDIDEEVRESEIEKNALFKKELEKIVENLQLLEHEMVIVSSNIIDTKK